MAFTSGPFAATVTSSLTINPPQPGGTYYDRVIVSNVSPFLATVVIGSAQSFLLPYTADLFDVETSGTSVSVAMSQAPGGPATSVAGASAFVTGEWYLPTDSLPGAAYPISLTSQAVTAAIAGAVTSSYTESLLTSRTASAYVATPPAGTQALRILVPAGSTTRPSVVGGTTGEPYPVLQQWGNTTGAVLESVFICAVDTSADATFTITFSGSTTFQVVAINAPQQISTYPASAGPAAQSAPGFTSLIGGTDGSGLLQQLTVVAGTAEVGGSDGTTVQPLGVTAPGAANPAHAQVVQAGSDGTNTHLLHTDSSGNQFVLGAAVSGLKSANWVSNVAAAGTTSIVAAVGGKTITIYMIDANVSAGAITVGLYIGGVQSATTGVWVAKARTRILTAVGDGGPIKMGTGGWIPGGFALPIGEGLQFLADAGNSANIDTAGIVYFTQA